ncbi:MAG: hypothetical protein ABR502_00040 [Chitinophagaceae bacterium]
MKKHYLLITLATMLCGMVYSQAGILKKLPGSKKGGGGGLTSIMEGNPAISTNFKDVNMEGTMPPEFGDGAPYVKLRTVPRDSLGNFLLKPGFYETFNFSYCLKAGTPSPNLSDGYGLAPLKGKQEDIVHAILVKSQQMWANKGTTTKEKSLLANAATAATKIAQKDVQLLLWAIIAKTDFEKLAGRSKAVALALLTPGEILKLNGGALKAGGNFLMDKGIINKPEPLRLIEEAQEKLRSLYYRADATFEDFERVALLAGMSNMPQIAPNRTWFKHPTEDYYVRYEPQGYSRTKIQVYVPPTTTQVNFKATGYVATPDDSRQRLAQTDWFVDNVIN